MAMMLKGNLSFRHPFPVKHSDNTKWEKSATFFMELSMSIDQPSLTALYKIKAICTARTWRSVTLYIDIKILQSTRVQ